VHIRRHGTLLQSLNGDDAPRSTLSHQFYGDPGRHTVHHNHGRMYYYIHGCRNGRITRKSVQKHTKA